MEPGNDATDDRRRCPRNLQDVLRMAIEAGESSNEPVPREDPPHPDVERQRFLVEALNGMNVDIVRIIKDATDALTVNLKRGPSALETCEGALDVIIEHVDNLDNANVFVRLEGFPTLAECLESPHPSIRWRAAEIVAICTQNNYFSQAKAMEMRLLEPLVAMTDRDSDDQCKTKAFFAVSNIVRDYPGGLKEFLRLNGFSTVKKAIKSDNKRLKNKAVLFLSSVVAHQPNVIWDVVSMGFPEILILQLREEPTPEDEYLVTSLINMVQNSQEALNTCKRSDLRLVNVLKQLIDHPTAKECYLELVEKAHELITILEKA
ncbi:HSP70 Hypothetical protein protein [Nesidiocoris tenuis]|uniref:Nucleotide exchange factor Fes1 domain-containing protein n=1 Tax=Nesidiocoris tenuis TaxID=355587 RepID=A0ABN7AS69_9HEMI|nr:HSP70 Hypothetical protein protein [Nesidiocoris tenuis]